MAICHSRADFSRALHAAAAAGASNAAAAALVLCPPAYTEAVWSESQPDATTLRNPQAVGACLTELKRSGFSGVASLRLDGCPISAGDLSTLADALHCHCAEVCGTYTQDAAFSGPASGEASNGGEHDDDANDFFDLFDVHETAEATVESLAHLGCQLAGPDAANEFSETPTPGGMLRTLAITRCLGIPSDAWSPFWRELPMCLTELDLTGNGLNDRAISALCGALRPESRLRHLVLKGNRCKDVERLCALLASGRLCSLDLAENILNDKSIVQLCTALSSPASMLQSLSLAGNHRISAGALQELVSLSSKDQGD